MQKEVGADSAAPAPRIHSDPIAAFPTSDQPVSDTVLKDMLLSLRAPLQADMVSCMAQHKVEIQELGERVDHVENTLSDFTEDYNTLVDAYSAQHEDISWIKAKLEYLKDRSRRNNLKIRGIPESIQSSQLCYFMRELLLAVLLNLTSADLKIDRSHSVPKPSFLPTEIPRDVIFFQVKKQLLEAFRHPSQLPEKASTLCLLPDLSQYTLQQPKNLLTITKVLQNHNIPYKYPAKLEITHQGFTSLATTLEECLSMLRTWDILPAQVPAPRQVYSPHKRTPDWQQVCYNRHA